MSARKTKGCAFCKRRHRPLWHTSAGVLVCSDCVAEGIDPTICVFESTPDDDRGLTYSGVTCAATAYAYPMMCDAAGVPHETETLRQYLWHRPFTANILCERALNLLMLRQSSRAP